MLNPEVLKCHKDLITLEMYNKEKQKIISFLYGENIKIFGYLGAWGGGGFNNQTAGLGSSWFIYPLF